MESPSADDITTSRAAIRAGIAALLISSCLIVMKTISWFITGSAVILASLADSISDAAASLINFWAIRQSLKPADEEHRYGHGKIEGLAALFQACFIGAAGFFVLMESLKRLVEPDPVNAHSVAIIVMVLSIIMTAGLVWFQGRSLKHANSLAVQADRAHYSGDLAANIVVIAVLVGDWFGGPVWLDPLGAIAVTVYLGFSAWHIGRGGVDMLLDREVSGPVREKILKTVLSHERVKGMHDLRTRNHGMTLHISFDVELGPKLLLCEAHAITRELEENLLKDFPNAEIMIHKDPAGDTDDARHQVKGVHH